MFFRALSPKTKYFKRFLSFNKPYKFMYIIVSLLSYEGPRHQNLGHLYRKTHNKKRNINQN